MIDGNKIQFFQNIFDGILLLPLNLHHIAVFTWDRTPEVLDFSYILNNDPLFIPDDIGEGFDVRANFNDVSDGVWYFHIKALGPGGWGGVSHYVVLIDSTPPAKFSVQSLEQLLKMFSQYFLSYLLMKPLALIIMRLNFFTPVIQVVPN